jgi:hypothetical protein
MAKNRSSPAPYRRPKAAYYETCRMNINTEMYILLAMVQYGVIGNLLLVANIKLR